VRAYEISRYGGIEGITLNPNREMPAPGPGEVLIRVHATSINYRDLVIVEGRFAALAKPSLIPLCDGAGEVVATGHGVDRFKVGDRVTSSFFPRWLAGGITGDAVTQMLGGTVDGVLAEYAILPASSILSIPAHLSYTEAATLPCAALTAWNAVIEVARVRAGQVVLLLGTGGVSVFALQFAKLQGARVIMTSSSDQKLARVRALGADDTLNYRSTPDWADQVMRLTQGEGVDLVVEVGGPGTLESSIKVVRPGGIIALVGVLAGAGQINPMPLLSKAARIQAVYVGSLEMFGSMNRAIAQARLRPIIDRVFPFERAKEAYVYQTTHQHLGKIVVAGV
jgi:NADPH:quinone reductase-like Zn-dependent oxidoreductase